MIWFWSLSKNSTSIFIRFVFLMAFNVSGYCSLTYPNFTDGNVKVGCYYFTMRHFRY